VSFVNFKIEGRAEVDRALRNLSLEYPKEAARALNATARRTRGRSLKATAAKIGIAQSNIKSRFMFFSANRNNLIAYAWIGTKAGLKLASIMGASSSLTGVIKAGKLRVQTFKARMPNGHFGQFIRKENSKHKVRLDGQRTELPIEEPRIRLGPIAQPILQHVSRRQMIEYFPKEFRRLIAVTNRRLAQRKAR